jgi:short subunit dehydrogenase-like uncharacterized protein
MSDRDLDILLWGATGFTGRLVAGHLAAHAPPGLRWAVAGRDAAKLHRLHGAVDAERLTADAHDPASLDVLAARARVVISTVGPYARHGTPLVEACVRHGIDYCDITGEPHWIRSTIDAFHDRARETGARIVHCCGFDSIPSDLGVWLAHEHLLRAHGTRLARAQLYVRKIHGGYSGGTIDSMLSLMELAARDRQVRRLLLDPYALNPADERRGPDGRDQTGARFDDDVGHWTAPFVMAVINTRVVRRTNALLGWPYGRDFRYGECVMVPGRLRATLMAAGTSAFTVAGGLAPTRWLLRRVLPSPGEGPSRAEREAGYFEIRVRGHAADGAAPPVEVRVAGDRDPGYGMTSIMLAEAALCLARDVPAGEGGVLTPASALGAALVTRLRNAGMRLGVV